MRIADYTYFCCNCQRTTNLSGTVRAAVGDLSDDKYIWYSRFCADCSEHAVLYDDRDYWLTMDQFKLEIIKAKL